jgi:hypothetical protein
LQDSIVSFCFFSLHGLSGKKKIFKRVATSKMQHLKPNKEFYTFYATLIGILHLIQKWQNCDKLDSSSKLNSSNNERWEPHYWA